MRTVGWLLSFALWSTASQTINFDSAKPGALPSGWIAVSQKSDGLPTWEVRKDSSAPSPPYVFAEVSNQNSGSVSPLAILNKMTVKDGDLSVKVKPVGGHEEPAGGLVWRYRDPNNYYLLRANALENTIMLYKVENGRTTPLESKGVRAFGVKHPVPANQWSVLKVQFHGPLFSVYFNHRRVFQVQDSTFAKAGKVGLWGESGGVTYFDDFHIAGK
ncbi:MAG TPA: hypothetical protein VMU80_07710 [Bryobacteraceae bacterium]|nr:hypothetical protein [Bryobacteraceae bacterium]